VMVVAPAVARVAARAVGWAAAATAAVRED